MSIQSPTWDLASRVGEPTGAAANVGRVAVVDPFSTGGQLAGVLAEHGVESVAVIATETFPAHLAIIDELDYVDVHTYRGDVAQTTRTLAQLGVGRVVAGSESGIFLADELAHRLRTPGNDPSTSRRRREKSAMSNALQAAGLAHPRTFTAHSPYGARNVAWQVGAWPVVVKPVDSAASDNVVFAQDADEVEQAARAILGGRNVFGALNTAVICQEYLSGRQYAVNTVSRRGAHRLVEVWADTRLVLPGHRSIYDRMDLLTPDDPVAARLYAYVERCLDALGIAEGPGHSEVILTGAGPVLVETGARLQGGDSVRLMREACGSSQADALAEAMVGEPADSGPTAYAYQGPVTQLFLQAPADGVISAATVEKLTAIPGVLGTVHPLHAGAPVSATIDLLSSPGTLYLAGDRATVENAYLAVRASERNGLYELESSAEPAAEHIEPHWRAV
jgi:biotin carboxylase